MIFEKQNLIGMWKLIKRVSIPDNAPGPNHEGKELIPFGRDFMLEDLLDDNGEEYICFKEKENQCLFVSFFKEKLTNDSESLTTVEDNKGIFKHHLYMFEIWDPGFYNFDYKSLRLGGGIAFFESLENGQLLIIGKNITSLYSEYWEKVVMDDYVFHESCSDLKDWFNK
jgi:hypothetical protein